MTAKSRIKTLEKRLYKPAQNKPSSYTLEKWQRSMSTLGEALGDILEIEPVSVPDVQSAISEVINDSKKQD